MFGITRSYFLAYSYVAQALNLISEKTDNILYIRRISEKTTIMAEMSKKEIRKFLMQGTFTGKLATIKKNGSPHIVPIWFVLDGDNRAGGSGRGEDIIFTTNGTSVKAKNIQRDNRVSICVDDQTSPFSFVIVNGIARILHCEQNELFRFATKIAQRYMGKENAELYGRRNSTDGEVLVRIKPTRIIAEKDIADWD
jgi:PPOX class probable F420-dependent enzyme